MWNYTQGDIDEVYNGQKAKIDWFVENFKKLQYKLHCLIEEFIYFESERGWDCALSLMNKSGFHWTTWSYKAKNMRSWELFNENGSLKNNPSKTSESDIRKIWVSSDIWAKPEYTCITYQHVKK